MRFRKKKSGSEYFGALNISTSYCDNYIAYSLDLQGLSIHYISRDLRTGKNEKDKIENTGGSITWALDNKSFFIQNWTDFTDLDKYLNM